MKNTFINLILKGLITGATFALGVIGIVYASNWISTTYNGGGETLTAGEGAQLTLSKWNALVGRVSGITTQSNGKVALTETSPAISDNNTEIPSTAAVKAYVDAQVSASASGGSSCPSEITAQQPAATLANAVKGCRDMVGGYRLPTFEELSCFIADSSMPGGMTIHGLLTRTQSTIGESYTNWLYLRLSDGYWNHYSYTNSGYYRCVR